MYVKDCMTADPACCTPDTDLHAVARMMIEHDCGEIPVVSSQTDRRPVGVVTDRDITVRTVGEGRNPLDMSAGDCMSVPCVTVTPDMSLHACCKVMEEKQIRRVPVVDGSGACIGIVALADIARHAGQGDLSEVVKEISEPASVVAKTC